MPAHLGGVWIKNFSGGHVTVQVTDANGNHHSHDYHPGHDAKINDIYIDGSWLPPLTKDLTVRLFEGGREIARRDFTFHLATLYQEIGGVYDFPGGKRIDQLDHPFDVLKEASDEYSKTFNK